MLNTFFRDHLAWWKRTYGTKTGLRPGYVERQWQALTKATDDAQKPVIIAREGTELVGLGWASIKPEEWFDCHIGYIHLILVDPNRQGKGIGTLLVRELQSWFAAEGVEGQQLNVSGHNARAISLYERHDFHITDHRMLGPRL